MMMGAANTVKMKNPEESKYCSPANKLQNVELLLVTGLYSAILCVLSLQEL